MCTVRYFERTYCGSRIDGSLGFTMLLVYFPSSYDKSTIA